MGKHDLWNSIVNEGLKNYENHLKSTTSTLIVVGAAKSGKTTLINLFLDKQEDVKGSLPVEYTYARRTNKHMVKDVCNVWEVNIANMSFIGQLIESENLDSISVLIVVDLSRAQHLNYTCQSVAEYHRSQSKYQAQINYGLIGMKYDKFEELETEKKSILSRFMKHYAAEIQAHLISCSKDDRATVKVAKDLLTHLAFQTKFGYQTKSDLNDPLIIPKGSSNTSDVDYLRQTFRTHFGQEVEYKPDATASSPAEDPNYADEQIDIRRKGNITPSRKDASSDL